MSCVDFVLETCECYFWQRKLISGGIAIVSGVVVYFVTSVIDSSWIICLIAGVLLGGVFGTTYWVLTSESYCYGSSFLCAKEPKILDIENQRYK